MPRPSELLSKSLKDTAGVDRKKLDELGRIIDSLYAPTAPAVSVFPGGGGGSLLMVPGTLSVNSVNNPDGNHTHAITTSSNPGAAASILATDVSGALTLRSLNVGAASGAAPGEVRASVGFAARVDGPGGGFFAGANSDVQLHRDTGGVWRTPNTFVFDNVVLIGATASFGSEYKLQVSRNGEAFLTSTVYSNLAGEAGAWVMRRARGDMSTPSNVLSGDLLGQVRFDMHAGVGFSPAASIRSYVDGVPGENDYPSRIEVWTTPDGSATQQQVAALRATGQLQLAIAGPNAGVVIAGDFNLYRSAANEGTIPDELIIGSNTAKAKIGSWVGGATTYMAVAHASHFGTLGNVALLQGSAGDTILNSAAGQTLSFTIDVGGVGLFTTTGQFQVPVPGINAGVLIGGDVKLYRSAANMGRFPGGLTVDLGFNVGSATGAATGEVKTALDGSPKFTAVAAGISVNAALVGHGSRGTLASPSASLLNDILLQVEAFGRGATGYSSASRARMAFEVDANWSDVSQGTRVQFYQTPVGSTTTRRTWTMVASTDETILSAYRASDGNFVIVANYVDSTDKIVWGGQGDAFTSPTTHEWDVNSSRKMLLDTNGLTVDNGFNIGAATGAATGEARASVGFAARVDGASGGYVAGALSDVRWYRDTGPRWRTPNNVLIDGTLTIGSPQFSADISIGSAAPRISMDETDAPANNRVWDILVQGEQLALRAVNDAFTVAGNWCVVDRTGTTIDSVKFENAGYLMRTLSALNNGAGANTATLTNAPVAGNPTKWVPIDDNGTTRYVPAW